VSAESSTPDAARSSIAQAQTRVDAWIRAHGGYWSDLSQYVRLVEEVGELGRELNHRYGDKPRRDKDLPGSIMDELGDVFFILLLLANSLGIDLELALTQTLEKYEGRA
jgi:NTP pyrophosphatase (non-canonical NTP hydrolase)